jgi:hypothetical protein
MLLVDCEQLGVLTQQCPLLAGFVQEALPDDRLVLLGEQLGVADEDVVAPIAVDAGDRTEGFLLRGLGLQEVAGHQHDGDDCRLLFALLHRTDHLRLALAVPQGVELEIHIEESCQHRDR